jgi:hypothetical protein
MTPNDVSPGTTDDGTGTGNSNRALIGSCFSGTANDKLFHGKGLKGTGLMGNRLAMPHAQPPIPMMVTVATLFGIARNNIVFSCRW